MNADRQQELRQIPIDRIEVLNPRERNSRAFGEIVGNINTIGLKKPIVVTPRRGPNGDERYLLVCGEGRMKAFKALGEATIPALVVAVDDEDAFIMSLTENIARRQWRPLELLAGIEQLRDRGYQKEVERQKAMVRKATFAQQRLLFAVSALQQLFQDENFVNLLRAEGLDTLPKYLAERVWTDGRRT